MKRAILIVYMGGPSTLKEIKPFLYRLFSDRDLINLGVPSFLQKPLAYLIASIRAKKVKPNYEAIGGGSPTVKYSVEIAKEVEKLTGIKTFTGMLYSKPLLTETVKEIKAYNPDEIVAITLYPHYSLATAGACIRDIRKELPSAKVVKSWNKNPYYIKWITNQIKNSINTLKNPFILFSAHSLPEYLIQQGDPYLNETEETISLVMENFRGFPYKLSFQSKIGPIEWIKPSTEETIEELGEKGVKELVVFPISFISEHIETLFELDVEYKEVAEKAGIERYVRVPLNHKDDNLIKAIATECEKLFRR
ncbi:ferrochelatase [Desulfurobacterium atlanticum]|uniref:Ferrochelatase n=1 Tax=Desulfurobacterium atlanticum TaxID=240169 RepID=A0A238XKI5_9BACT|nr:ferrochelatase [Desulfurobacterium atlanticum]SNR59447.1 ferrochelatase [Desulfurobacterium atlanticum]